MLEVTLLDEETTGCSYTTILVKLNVVLKSSARQPSAGRVRNYSLNGLVQLRPDPNSSTRALRLRRIDLDMLVPNQLVHDSVAMNAVANDLFEARSVVQRQLDELLRDPFEGGKFDVDSLNLGALARVRAIGELIEPIEDPVHRAEFEYPFQIASLARTYRLARSADERLESGLRLAEATCRALGVVGAALIAAGDTDSEAIGQAFQGGISTGSWLHLIKEAGGVVHGQRTW